MVQSSDDGKGKSAEQRLREDLHKRARKQTLATLPAFITECANVEAGYGECVVATGAAMLATFCAMNDSAPTCRGGMTGFQAGAATWEIIKAIGVFGGEDAILAFFDHTQLLFPQYDHKRIAIPAEIWDKLKRQAIQNLTREDLANVARPVVDRWREIAQGAICGRRSERRCLLSADELRLRVQTEVLDGREPSTPDTLSLMIRNNIRGGWVEEPLALDVHRAEALYEKTITWLMQHRAHHAATKKGGAS